MQLMLIVIVLNVVEKPDYGLEVIKLFGLQQGKISGARLKMMKMERLSGSVIVADLKKRN